MVDQELEGGELEKIIPPRIVGLSILVLDCHPCLEFGVGEEGRGHADNGCIKSPVWIFDLISGFKGG